MIAIIITVIVIINTVYYEACFKHQVSSNQQLLIWNNGCKRTILFRSLSISISGDVFITLSYRYAFDN